jgi:hypothetical protein
MPVQVQCAVCGKAEAVQPRRAKTYKTCSHRCYGLWRSKHYSGENHPQWQHDRVSEKVCGHCGEAFYPKVREPTSTFKARKFCSKPCADKGGFRYEGEAHPNWKPVTRRKDRRGKHGSWAKAVISRDLATCQHCGATEVELHAHHIKSFAGHPAERWDIDNGLTLCAPCHWAIHTASTANEVNSGNTLTDNAEGNPEPSFGRKPEEGITTRGRAYRRWSGPCAWCGTFVSKPWSDVKPYRATYCCKSCSSYGRAAMRRGDPLPHPSTAVISSTSASPERDDIV